MSRKHSLSAKDKTALTADCSVCGPAVEIRRNGKYGFVCMVARREARKNWRRAHPARSRSNYATSGHSLERRDGLPDVCSKCGPVTVAPWGRGWACANLLAEKKWRPTQISPDPKCGVCNKLWLVNGMCPDCDAPPEPEYVQLRNPDWLETHLKINGLTIQSTETDLPMTIESAVHGWKTLGSAETKVGYAHLADEWDGRPKYIRPEYAALYGSGRS